MLPLVAIPQTLKPIRHRRAKARRIDLKKALFSLHEKQQIVHDDRTRFRVLCCGRRFGKSRLAMAEAVKRSLEYDGPYDIASPPVIVIGLPNLPMAKRVFFRPLSRLLQGHPDVERINRSESIIHMKGDRPDIICMGLNDGFGERARGLRIWGFLGDEIQAIKRGILDEVIIPAMADTPNSWALLTGTPKSKLNHLYDLTQRSRTENDWAYYHFKTSDNPYVPREELERAKRVLDPRTYRQEYEASFEDFLGKIFSEFDRDRHVIDTIPEKFDRVFMGVDWGDLNPAIVVVGYKDEKYFVVAEYYNDTGQIVPEDQFKAKVQALAEEWGIWRPYCDPSRPSSILSLRQLGEKIYRQQKITAQRKGFTLREATKKLAKACGLMGLKRAVKGFNRIEEGLATVNSFLHQDKLFVYSKLTHFIECFESYHRATDVDGKVIEKVEDGQDDHTNDATRYVIATIEANKVMK